ncbi:DUF6869 domain-containing protein [Sphingomonas sp.]|uniref:DUF6869 domain-containing protein n=1 Tax=Sphingomonas sp. TaxID=28214 RepID=UPI0025E9AC9C|nr:hypothetical protein [Sphingomonas sp.]
MHPTPHQIAACWIRYARYDPRAVPDRVFQRGWLLIELARLHPALAWEAIKCIVGYYTEEELFTEAATEARRIVANTAAGPLETLLAAHGVAFIEAVEADARRDRRMLWALGCVWQNSISDDVWMRVQRAAGHVSR